MLAKFMVVGQCEPPIGIKYNLKIGRVTIGGNPRHLEIMESLITDYFQRKAIPRKRFFARNKVRMEFDVVNTKFFEAMQRMREYGISVQDVKTHGRLMR